jgi:hypothetical protein
MNQADLVGRDEALPRLHEDAHDSLEIGSLLHDPLPKCATFDVFHGEKGAPVEDPEIVDRDHVRMSKARECLGLTQEAPSRTRE